MRSLLDFYEEILKFSGFFCLSRVRSLFLDFYLLDFPGEFLSSCSWCLRLQWGSFGEYVLDKMQSRNTTW